MIPSSDRDQILTNDPVPFCDDYDSQIRGLIQEEVHGVHCMNPEETPEFVKKSLSELAEILDSDEKIPEHDKKAYVASQKLTSSTYINTDEFRLRFLRADLFNIARAARTMTKFLDSVVELFGSCVLERPIHLDDFDKDELKLLKKGTMQLLPFRDRFGRRVLVIFPSDQMQQIGPNLQLKFWLYLSYSAGTNDIDTQRKGLVILVWAQRGESFRTDFYFRIRPHWIWMKVTEIRSLRVSAFHTCLPDTALWRILRDIIIETLRGRDRSITTEVATAGVTRKSTTDNDSNYARRPDLPSTSIGARLRIHMGEPIELQNALRSYGIPTDKIPITLSSTIKISYFNQWLWIRQYIEQGMSIVECPGSYDVVFRKGTAAMYHPGNVWFLNLIQCRFEDHLLFLYQKHKKAGAGNFNNDNDYHATIIDNFKLTPELLRSLTNDLILVIEEAPGRILTWYDNKGYGCVGWWTVLVDPEQRYSKIEYTVTREFKKLITSVARAHKKNKRKGGSNSEADMILESGTSIFLSQDGKTDTEAGVGEDYNPRIMNCDESVGSFGSLVDGHF